MSQHVYANSISTTRKIQAAVRQQINWIFPILNLFPQAIAAPAMACLFWTTGDHVLLGFGEA